MKKRLTAVILPLIAIVLELLPWGAVLIFAPSPGERLRETASYFSLTPFGYGNFGPLITAILSCLLLAAALWNLAKRNKAKLLFVLSVLALIASLSPLCLGFRFYSLTAAFISAVLALEVWIARRLAKSI